MNNDWNGLKVGDKVKFIVDPRGLGVVGEIVGLGQVDKTKSLMKANDGSIFEVVCEQCKFIN